jgi:ribosomal protein L37AE/L43A
MNVALCEVDMATIQCRLCNTKNHTSAVDGLLKCSGCGDEVYIKFYRATIQYRMFTLVEKDSFHE